MGTDAENMALLLGLFVGFVSGAFIVAFIALSVMGR